MSTLALNYVFNYDYSVPYNHQLFLVALFNTNTPQSTVGDYHIQVSSDMMGPKHVVEMVSWINALSVKFVFLPSFHQILFIILSFCDPYQFWTRQAQANRRYHKQDDQEILTSCHDSSTAASQKIDSAIPLFNSLHLPCTMTFWVFSTTFIGHTLGFHVHLQNFLHICAITGIFCQLFFPTPENSMRVVRTSRSSFFLVYIEYHTHFTGKIKNLRVQKSGHF